jgi:hypothetical protein
VFFFSPAEWIICFYYFCISCLREEGARGAGFSGVYVLGIFILVHEIFVGVDGNEGSRGTTLHHIRCCGRHISTLNNTKRNSIDFVSQILSESILCRLRISKLQTYMLFSPDVLAPQL